MTAFSLVPRDNYFFKEFISLAEEVRSGSRVLKQMIASDPPDISKVELIKEIEHACDRCTRAIIDRLNRTFVTPLDREDLYALASALDNVMDAIDHAAALLRLYKIEEARPGARELAHTVSSSAGSLHTALDALAARQPVHPHAVEINRLENEADRAYQNAVRVLFETETDPVTIIKWKELFDVLEQVTDCCEDVANLIEGVVVKHG